MFYWIRWCIQHFFPTSSLKVIGKKQSANVPSQCVNVYFANSCLTILMNEKLITPVDSLEKNIYFPYLTFQIQPSTFNNIKAILSCIFIIMLAILKWKRGRGTLLQRQATEWMFPSCQPMRLQHFHLKCDLVVYDYVLKCIDLGQSPANSQPIASL